MEYQYSYKGFLIWFVCFVAIMLSISFLPFHYEILVRLTLNLCSLGITDLMYIIYKTEYIYWFNGIDYDTALKVGKERRKEYAYQHFSLFLKGSLILMILSLVFSLLHFHFVFDIIVFLMILIATAILSMPIKL